MIGNSIKIVGTAVDRRHKTPEYRNVAFKIRRAKLPSITFPHHILFSGQYSALPNASNASKLSDELLYIFYPPLVKSL